MAGAVFLDIFNFAYGHEKTLRRHVKLRLGARRVDLLCRDLLLEVISEAYASKRSVEVQEQGQWLDHGCQLGRLALTRCL